MAELAEFERYMKQLCEVLGHADRHAGFADYSCALMLPTERKSVEPIAAHTDPRHGSAKHESLHHVVAQSDWSDEAVLSPVRAWASPALKLLPKVSHFAMIQDPHAFNRDVLEFLAR